MQRLAVFVVVATLLAIPVVAQTQYGTVAGTVIDNEQKALPGATVTLSGPFMQGSRAAITDAEGNYRFAPVPPGTGYEMKFELTGFNRLEKTGVVVNLGKETRVDAQMSLSKFAETITVTAEKIVVDTTKSTVDTNVDWKLVNSLATNRNFQNMMQMAPGVKSGNNPYVHGSSNDGNVYMIDGVDTTDPRTQTWGTAINWDTIQEAQVETGGFQAEYGRATGGIVNLITKSGGNRFSVSARYIWQRIDWSAKGGVDSETGNKKPGGASDEQRPSLTVGGPIISDALWFCLAGEKRANHRDFGRYMTIQDAANNIQTKGRSNYEGHYVSGKLTYQINPSHSLVGYYNEDPITLDPLRAGWYGVNYNPSMEQQQFQGGHNSSLQWYGVLSPNFFLEGKYQHHSQELNVTPLDGSTFGQIPYMRDLTAGYYYGAAQYNYKSARTRNGGSLAASYFLDTTEGSHQFKAGLEYLKMSPDTARVYNPLGYYYTRNLGTTPYRRYLWLDQVSSNVTDQNYWAIYAQDAWRIGKLTLNVGVRAESTAIKNNEGTELVKFGFGDQIAPRLGFAYDLNGDSIHGSLGRFYSLASNYLADYFNVIPTHEQRWDWRGTCTVDPATPVWQYPDSCWRLRWDVPTGASGNTLDPSLKPASIDEFTVGYDKLLSAQYAASVAFTWRQQKYAIDAYDPTGSGEYLITNTPNNLPNADGNSLGNKFSEYQAIELNFKKRFGPDGLQFIANYTYVLRSRSWVRDWANTYPDICTDPDSCNANWYGEVESPHEIKFNGSYTMPWKTTVGISTYWNSGNVYTPYHTGDNGGSVADARRGSLRVGSLYSTDLHVEQPVTYRGFTAAVYFDLFNLFNQQQVLTRNGNDAQATYKQPLTWAAPRRFQVGVRFEY